MKRSPDETPHLRTWIVEDHSSIRELFGEFVRQTPGFELVGASSGADEAIAAAREGRVDFVILDLLLPGLPGLEALARLTELPRPPKVMVFSAVNSQQAFEICVQRGVVGFVEKTTPLDQFQQALQRIRAGGCYFSEGVGNMIAGLIAQKRPGDSSAMQNRKRQLIRQLGQGLNVKSIATAMNLSEQYVYRLRQDLFREWNVETEQQLVVSAIRAGYIDIHELGAPVPSVIPPPAPGRADRK